MLLLYFLGNYISIYDKFHWMYLLTGAICIKRQEKLIQENQIWDHTGSLQNQPSAGIWKIILETYERIIKQNHQNCLFDKREISHDKPSACEKRWEPFLQKK